MGGRHGGTDCTVENLVSREQKIEVKRAAQKSVMFLIGKLLQTSQL